MHKNSLKLRRYYFRAKYEMALGVGNILQTFKYSQRQTKPNSRSEWNREKVVYIIFSKDRAAQLDLLLASMELNLDLIPQVIVIVKATNPVFRAAYDRVFSKHSKVISEVFEEGVTLTFRDCFIRAYALSAKAEFIGFLVDDAVFYRATTIASIFDHPKRQLVFCTRLGMNINYNYVQGIEQPKPNISIVCGSGNDRLITWKFDLGLGDWARPFALDGNIYKKDIIDPLINLIWFESPNTLECELQNFNYMSKSFFPLAYFKSISFLLPLNRVQDDFSNRAMDFTPDLINQKFLNGTTFDVKQFCGITPTSSTFEYIPGELL